MFGEAISHEFIRNPGRSHMRMIPVVPVCGDEMLGPLLPPGLFRVPLVVEPPLKVVCDAALEHRARRRVNDRLVEF
ncbi:hypothetical protein D3C71_156550 [compost metagenome]